MRVMGASPLRLALPGILLAIVLAAFTFLLVQRIEPLTLVRLHHALGQSAARALVLGAQPRRFYQHPVAGGTTLYVEERVRSSEGEARFRGLLLSTHDPKPLLRAGKSRSENPGQRKILTILLARRATLRVLGWSVHLDLEDGELHQRNRQGGLRRIRFRRLQRTLDLAPSLEPHFGFLSRRAADRTRPLKAAGSVLALGLLATAIALGARSRLRMAAAGVAAVLSYQLGSFGIGLVWTGGPILVAGAAALFSLVILVWTGRRGS